MLNMRILRFIWALIKYVLIGERVSKEEYQTRLTLCYSCEHLKNTQCEICGCYVKKKAKWSTESCPKNKW
jgi:uncharacterized protein (DUF2141 family)